MTMYSVSQEAYVLLITMCGGLLIGLIYTLYKVFRGIFRPRKIATDIQDILFWSLISAVAFYVLIISNQGQLRFYNFLGFMVGILLYHLLFSAAITAILLFVVKWSKAVIKDLWKLILYPVQVGFCLITVPYSYCKKRTKPVYYKTKQGVKDKLRKEAERWQREKKST